MILWLRKFIAHLTLTKLVTEETEILTHNKNDSQDCVLLSLYYLFPNIKHSSLHNILGIIQNKTW